MHRTKNALGVAALLLVLGLAASVHADQILVSAGSSWRYNDTGANLGTGWRAAAYNDSAWPSGNAQIGYGDGDESTVLSYGSSTTYRRIAYYFRRSFIVQTPSSIAALTVRLMRDDGAVVYLNGVEVVRSNMPTGTIGYTTLATAAVSGADESAWQEVAIDPARLVAGTNVIAVEVHQQSPSSGDVTFDLELRAVPSQPAGPTVTLTAPANHAVANNPSVTFTASVAAPDGLSHATLFVGGPPLTLTFTGPTHVQDAHIVADTPAVADGAGLAINVDGQAPHVHGLMRFPTLFQAGQVPSGATIVSASLQINCTNAGNAMRLYRLVEDWSEDQATWNQRLPGTAWASPGADGTGSNAGIAVTGDCTATGRRLVDLTAFVQEWSGGTPNYGIVLVESGTDGVDFDSSESATPPVLTVQFKSQQQAIETKPVAGTSSSVRFTTALPLAQTYSWNVRITDLLGRQAWASSDFDVTIDASSPNEPDQPAPASGTTMRSSSAGPR